MMTIDLLSEDSNDACIPMMFLNVVGLRNSIQLLVNLQEKLEYKMVCLVFIFSLHLLKGGGGM